MQSFADGICLRIFDRDRMRFDAPIRKQKLKIMVVELSTIVVHAFVRAWMSTKPFMFKHARGSTAVAFATFHFDKVRDGVCHRKSAESHLLSVNRDAPRTNRINCDFCKRLEKRFSRRQVTAAASRVLALLTFSTGRRELGDTFIQIRMTKMCSNRCCQASHTNVKQHLMVPLNSFIER